MVQENEITVLSTFETFYCFPDLDIWRFWKDSDNIYILFKYIGLFKDLLKTWYLCCIVECKLAQLWE